MELPHDPVEYLETLTEDRLPEFIAGLSPSDQAQLKTFVDSLIERQNAGLDRLFESMGMAMGYIPRFVLVTMTRRFIEPPICARMTRMLDLKQVVRVGNSLPPEYLVEVTRFQSNELAAKILHALAPELVESALATLSRDHPYRAIDLYAHVSLRWQALIARELRWSRLDPERLQSPARRQVVEALRGSAAD